MLLVQFKKNLEWFPTLVHLVLRHQCALFDDDAKKPFQAEKGEARIQLRSATLAYAA
ncbi:hypothetical protein [Aeromonas sp. QDB13]|nr:hypothetical protein [Aeromonas sp. QDB13]